MGISSFVSQTLLKGGIFLKPHYTVKVNQVPEIGPWKTCYKVTAMATVTAASKHGSSLSVNVNKNKWK